MPPFFYLYLWNRGNLFTALGIRALCRASVRAAALLRSALRGLGLDSSAGNRGTHQVDQPV